MIDLVDETVRSLPVDGWRVVQSPYQEDCSVEGGKVMYVYGKMGNNGRNPELDAETVASLWKKHGLTVDLTRSGGSHPYPIVWAQGGPVQRMQFLGNPAGYSVSGVSHCIP